MSKIRKCLLILLTPIIVFMGLVTPQTVNAASSQELTKVITDISLWDVSNGETLRPNGSGKYSLIKNNNYRFESKFDLSKYDGKLNDGDYFTFTVPAPITVANTNFELKDKETDLAIGTAVVTSNGDSQGGTVTLTLKNLQDYLTKKGGSQVQGVKGTFYTEFKVRKVLDSQTLSYSKSETSKEITHTITVKERGESDYTEGIKKENFAKIGGVMEKEAWNSNILSKKGDYLHNWRLRINTNQSSYDSITLKDVIPDDSAPMQIIPEKLKVYAGYFNSSLNLTDVQELKEGEGYTIKYNSAYTNFELKLLNTSTRLATNGKPAAYNVYYSTTSPANGTDIINELSMKGGETDLTTSTERQNTVHRVTRSTKITTGGTIQLDTGYRITLYKQDAETGNLLNGAEFEITSPSGEKETVKIEKDGVAQSKVYSAEEAGKGEFTIVETKAPKGYALDKTPIKVTVGKDGIIRTIKNTKEKVSIPVTKVWDDFDNKGQLRPDSITVNLLANGKKVEGKTLTLNAQNNWTSAFEGLDKYDETGAEIQYTVEEEQFSDDYQAKVTGSMKDGFSLTNTIRKTKVVAMKSWKDGEEPEPVFTSAEGLDEGEAQPAITDTSLRPDNVQVQLYANDAPVGSPVMLNNENGWMYTWDNLPMYQNKEKIQYTIKEVSNTPGYILKDITYDNFDDREDEQGNKISEVFATIVNAKVTSISGKKIWDDANNRDGKRPEKVRLHLLANGEDTGKFVDVSEETNWEYEFKDLIEYDDDYNKINYSIKEDSVEGYTSKIEGYNVINSYTPAKTSISGTKTWNDNDNQDGKRPDSIVVNLLANGKKVASQEVTAANNWAYQFTDLPQYENGQLITYTVSEDAVDSYSTSINGYNITNSYTPETVDIKATKNWDDNENQDGKRPTAITVNLLANGEKVDSKEVTAAEDGTWSTTFTNLPKYKNGKEIKYTVTEEAVKEYETAIKDFTITNKYIPKSIEYKVTKIWNDNNNQDGKRPTAITVQLYKSIGGATPTPVDGKTLTLTAANQTDGNTWVASFTNLPQFENGQEIAYSIQEVDTPEGYIASVEGQTITNAHTPETIVLSGQKKWNDNNNQDGKRSTSVKVQILKGEEVVDEIEVSEATNWKFQSKALPKYENGKEITYTVKEVAVTAYETKIEKADNGQYTITNTHTPEKINLSGQKIWNDNNNQDGIRPANIMVELLANGEATGQTATASEATAWQYSFENLERYKDGKEISYSVKEVNIPEGYKAEVDGMNVTNNHVPEIINLTGQKTWNDNNDQDGIRPQSITLHLLANGVDTGLTATATAGTNWSYSFKGIAKYENGKEITYTVSEDAVDGYTSAVDGMNVTNTHTPTTPETPKSDKPNSPSNNQKERPKHSSPLPATGDKNGVKLIILGILLIIVTISGVIYYKSKKM
ncbi:Cna B-type domain-containing protein [Streptococcus equi]|nr:Cna B-type domain-containing protein [Streptococcus equi]